MRSLLCVTALCVLATLAVVTGQKHQAKIPGDGGMAFPGVRTEEHRPNELVDVTYPGLSIRDEFAKAALVGWGLDRLAYDIEATEPDADKIAATCYRLADAMLKARAIKP